MKFLLKQVHITDPHSPHHRSRKDILITDGIITRIADHIEEAADQQVTAEELYVSPGWMDLFAHFCDPGYEFRETLQTGALELSRHFGWPEIARHTLDIYLELFND